MNQQPSIKEQLAMKAMQVYGVQSNSEEIPTISQVLKIARTNLAPERYDRLSGQMAEVLAEVADDMADTKSDQEEEVDEHTS